MFRLIVLMAGLKRLDTCIAASALAIITERRTTCGERPPWLKFAAFSQLTSFLRSSSGFIGEFEAEPLGKCSRSLSCSSGSVFLLQDLCLALAVKLL